MYLDELMIKSYNTFDIGIPDLFELDTILPRSVCPYISPLPISATFIRPKHLV